MEVYWKLASADASEREAASVELVQNLLLQQKEEPAKGKLEAQEKENTHKKDLRIRKRKAGTKEDAKGDVASEDDGLDDCTASVQYALKRLVRGVSSSRECARQGFAMALASLLEAIPSIRIESVLKLVKQSLEVTSSMKGEERRDGLLGQLFALGAIVRGGRLIADNAHADGASLARDMAEQLLTLAKRKVFLREPAITVLLQFLERLPEVLQDRVLSSPLLQETLCSDVENASADTLLLALKLRDRLPSSVVESCPLLPNTSGTNALFEPFQLLSLIPVFKDSSSCHPRVHPIWNLLTELLFNEVNGHEPLMTPKKKKKRQEMDGTEASKRIEERVSSFWTLVVNNSLLTSSHERKFLAMEVLRLVLPKMPAQSARVVLSKTLVRCLLDILMAKGNLLYKSAQLCLDFIVDWAKADEQKTVATIICLQQGSHGKFDALSKTQVVKQLVGSLGSKEACSLLFNKLVDLFNGEGDAELVNDGHEQHEGEREHAGDPVKAVDIQRFWVIEQIHSCIKQVREPEAQLCLQKEAIKFLTLNALFVGRSGAKFYLDELQGKEVWLPKQPISDNIRKLCLSRLQSLLVNITPASTSLKKKDLEGEENLSLKRVGTSDLRFFFLELCDMLDKVSTLSRVQHVSDDDKETISALKSSISKLWSLSSKGSSEQRLKMQAMSSLLMQLLLQSVTSGVNEIASELVLCCERAFAESMEVDVNGGTEESNGETPTFMDVLVDVLLSLLAQSSVPVRAAAEQVFRAFSSNLTESTLLSLLRVVKKQLKRGRRPAAAPLGIDTDDEDQFLEIEESDEEEVDEVDINDEKDDGGEDDNYDEDGDHEKMDEMAGAPNGKKRRKKDVEDNEAMADTDKESNKDESESDIDDEAMFRIDVHLANLLKQRGVAGDKKEAKDAQTQLLHFKFRVLSLVEYFFQKRASSTLCLTALPHLLQALVLSVGGNAQLAERIGSVLFRLYKAKEYPKGPEVDMTAILDLLQRCVRLASRSKAEKVRKVGQSSSLWLAKVLHGQHDAETDKLVKVVQDAMNDFFSQKKSKLKAPFFRELFTRFPGLGMACIPLLVDRVKNARSEYLQYEALSLVTSVLHLNTNKNSKELKECLRQYLSVLSEVLVTLIEKPPSKAARKPESRRFCMCLLKAVSNELPSKPMKKAIGKHAYELCLSHFGASVMGGMTSQEVSAGNMVEKTKGKSKKRKSAKQME